MINMADRKRVIKGVKDFGKKGLKFTGKYGLKALAGTLELGVRGGTRILNSLANSKQFHVIASGGGIIAASVLIPPVALGTGAFIASKYLADKVLGNDATLIDEIKSTILLGSKATNLVCTQFISPFLTKANTKAKDLGKTAQSAIDDLDIFK